ncbi:MAG: Fur family transcriptional regulator, partial [Methylophilaceae bacterium]
MNTNTNFIEKLRSSGLRPTKQRIKICEALFDRNETFHFTINDLAKTIEEKLNEKISLATVYNTVHAFKKKGYLKEISINSDKSYFDTNTSVHHHF